jgi:uncharacterized protein
VDIFNVFPFLIVGVAVGFLGGFLGVGGGPLMIPLLSYWAFPAMHIPPEIIFHLSLGTSLAIIIPISISGSWAHAKAGNVDWRIVFILALPGILASFLGSALAAQLKGEMLKTLFGVLLIGIAAQMIFQKKGAESSNSQSTPRFFVILIIGFSVGLFSGFFAVGGAVIAIPLMVRFLGISIHQAMGNSIAFVFFASLVGTTGYIYNGWGNSHLPPFTFGYVHLLGWFFAGIPSIFSSQWGARLARKTRPAPLRRAFAFLLMVIGIRMLF